MIALIILIEVFRNKFASRYIGGLRSQYTFRVEEYEFIKVNDHKNTLLKVKDYKGFAAATSTPEMKEWDKENGYKDICYSLTPVEPAKKRIY